MPLFTNMIPLNDQTQNASDEAGIAVIRAIREAFWGFEAYEYSAIGQPDLAITRLRSSAEMFEQSAARYQRLTEIVPNRDLNVSEDVLIAFDAAFRFNRAMGGEGLQSFSDDHYKLATTNPIPSSFLIALARQVSEEVGRRLKEVPLDYRSRNIGHRLASDIAMVQMFGLTATKASEAYQH
jgi:hypothetical protein